jgi:polyhydroxyalkanoate synthesis regulator phasin
MPKKKRQETQAEQTQRFRMKVQELIDAGELNPTEADAAFEELMGNISHAANEKR